nr:PIN domain-containing protein [Pseudomonas sp.]
MKNMYGWHVPRTESEIKQFWEEGVLTVDTNVLLDLYRYHKETRESLLNIIKSFEGRLWLSHQAAFEFFENRKKVILLSREGFKDAQEEILNLHSKCNEVLARLVGNRIIPSELTKSLRCSLEAGLEKARGELDSASKEFPDFLKEDPILEKLLELFDECVGEDFPENVKAEAIKEAERRLKEEIPPGYLDKPKGAARAKGDYFVWRQILDYSKNNKAKVIFVTSEKKEDWWEEHKGKTVGPRAELLKESAVEADGNVIIYQTERFLEYAGKYTGESVSAEALEEVRLLGSKNAEPRNTVIVLSDERIHEDEDLIAGIIKVELVRPVHHFTVSSKVEPPLDHIPYIDVSLSDYPTDSGAIVSSASTGTKYDFNIHAKALERREALRPGTYSFDYVLYKSQELIAHFKELNS